MAESKLESPFCVCGHHEACHEGYGYVETSGKCLAHEIKEGKKVYCDCPQLKRLSPNYYPK